MLGVQSYIPKRSPYIPACQGRSVVRRGSYRTRGGLEVIPLPRVTREPVPALTLPEKAVLEILEVVARRVPMDRHLIGFNPVAHEMGIPQLPLPIPRVAARFTGRGGGEGGPAPVGFARPPALA